MGLLGRHYYLTRPIRRVRFVQGCRVAAAECLSRGLNRRLTDPRLESLELDDIQKQHFQSQCADFRTSFFSSLFFEKNVILYLY